MITKAVLFDFDYTLGDSTKAIVTSINDALLRLGHEESPTEEIVKTIGYRLQEAYRMLIPEGVKENEEVFKSYFMEKADEVMTRDTILYDGVLELAKDLKNQGLKLGIVTTKSKYRIESILEKYEAEEYFDLIIGGDTVENEKPAPDGIFLAEELLGVTPEEVLYVGDSLVDAKTARAAKVPFAAVTTGVVKEEAFKEYPNIAVLSHVTKIIEILDRI